MDLLRELAEIIGIRLAFVQDKSWVALTTQFEGKQLDVLTAYEVTPEHEKHALFSLTKLSELQSIFTRDFTMAVNLSPLQFRDSELVEWIRTGAEACKIDFKKIELEITEGVLLNEYDYVVNALTELTALGLKISLDDFGTGYSSMSYLRKYPFGSLKIDQEFIRDMTEDNDDKTLVKTTIDLAHDLGMEVVAEDVELEEHAAMLIEMGCDTVQGYLFSKPLPFDQLVSYIKNNKTQRSA